MPIHYHCTTVVFRRLILKVLSSNPAGHKKNFRLDNSILLISISGLAAIYVNKERSGKDHFTTWHGLIGIITMVYSCAQSVGGALAKYYKYVGKIIKVNCIQFLIIKDPQMTIKLFILNVLTKYQINRKSLSICQITLWNKLIIFNCFFPLSFEIENTIKIN